MAGEVPTDPDPDDTISGTCGDNLTWTYDEAAATLTISGTGEMDSWEDIESIPWHEIRSDIRSVVIEEGVASVGNDAFRGCGNLTSVTFPNGITSIGDRAFTDCYSLTDLAIPGSVASIGDMAFFVCRSLTSVTIPSSVTSIGSDAFALCSSLTSIYIPESVTSIGSSSAFYNCDDLTIYGKSGSYAETYANENNIPFVADGSSTPTIPTTPTDPTPDEPDEPASDEPVVETTTAEDGTVTTTTTWSDGKVAVAVKEPDGNTAITVTAPSGETMAEISIPAQPGEAKAFEDVNEGDWYKDAVDEATGYGLFSGTSETTFDPNTPMTRGMLVQVLHNLSGNPEYGVGDGNFEDVQNAAWYSDAVDWAAKAGVVYGTSDTEFSPDVSISREQLVTMLYRYAQAIGAGSGNKASVSAFPDGNKVADFAKDAMEWAVAEGFIQGREQAGGSVIAPQGTATRAEVAAVLTRFTEYLKK